MDATQRNYPTDLDDDQWFTIAPLIPPGKPLGCGRTTSMRAVVNAILYRQRSGCPWRMLPRDFPHWRTVYGYCRQWEHDGTWRQLAALLGRPAELRANRARVSSAVDAPLKPAAAEPCNMTLKAIG
ncbi:MAG: transposase [Pirellulales bacterium]|nr:transposase [Pirellulales bacterium]